MNVMQAELIGEDFVLEREPDKTVPNMLKRAEAAGMAV